MIKHAYWIHHAVKDTSQISGYKYQRSCDCSACGYTANLEKSTCPSCGAIMNQSVPKDAVIIEDSKSSK